MRRINKPMREGQYGHLTRSSTEGKEGYRAHRLDRNTLQSSLGQMVGTYAISSQPSDMSLLKSINVVNKAMKRTR